MSHDNALVLFYSKSTAAIDNEAGHDGLGGRISADEISSLAPRPTLLSGVSIVKAPGKNLSGKGKLVYTFAGQTLAWQAPRDKTPGVPVAVGAGGLFELESSEQDAWIRVSVVSLDLPVANQTVNVVLDSMKNRIFSDVSVQEAMTGFQDFRAFFLKNEGIVTYDDIYPVIELPSGPSSVQSRTTYAYSGSVGIKLAGPCDFPNAYYVRNKRTGEIMYYTHKAGGDGKTLIVPPTGRGLRGTSAAEGLPEDSIELVAPFDIYLEPYVPLIGAVKIVDVDVQPVGATFFYPSPSDAPNYPVLFSLAPDAVLTVWLRRTIPQGALEVAEQPMRLSFNYVAA